MNKSRLVSVFTILMLIVSVFPVLAQEPETPVVVQEEAIASNPLAVVITSPDDNFQTKVDEIITFNGTATGGTPPYVFHWDFGDDTAFNGRPHDKSYDTAGTYTAELTVTDFSGATHKDEVTVVVTNEVTPLAASITTPANNFSALVEQAITFSATATGGTPPYVFHWDFGDETAGNGPNFTKTYTATGTKDVTLSVTDFAGFEATAGLSLSVLEADEPDPNVPLTISNIRVTDLTHENAIIRWTTNKPASSRVVYDIVSHPSLTNQSAPNFGYAFSTETLDTSSNVTEHAVSVTNLTPETGYYFRVISQ